MTQMSNLSTISNTGESHLCQWSAEQHNISLNVMPVVSPRIKCADEVLLTLFSVDM